MKTLTLIISACLIVSGTFAQTTGIYCVDEVNGKTVVKHLNKIVTSTVNIDTVAQLLANGIVVWADKSSSILRTGDCIDASGIVYSEREGTDFIGDTNAINHIHMLPEVNINEERKIKTAPTPKESDSNNYMLYMKKLYKNIETNDYGIALIKEELRTKPKQESTKYRKKLNSIEKEIIELKIDFDIFIHFGIIEDWHLFRAEMNGDLWMLFQDITMMNTELHAYNIK